MARIDWNLRSRSRACMKCARPFEEKETVRSGVLAFEAPLVAELFAEKLAEEAAAAAAGQPVKPHPEYVRLDFCEDCWKALAPADWISVWKGPYVPPETAPEDPLRKATPETLLRSLIEGEEPENHIQAIYLLSVMLERKRILVERALKTAPDGTLVHVYEHRRSGDILLVADPRLTDDEIPGVQAEIELLLGLRPAASAAGSASSAETAIEGSVAPAGDDQPHSAPAADGNAAASGESAPRQA